MSRHHAIWHLEKLQFLDDLTREELGRLESHATILNYRKREHTTLADEDRSVYVLSEGLAKLYRVGFWGNKFVDAILQPGDVFGRIALEGRADGRHLLELVDDSVMIRLPRPLFAELLQRNPSFAFNVVQLLEERQRRLERRVESLIFKDVYTRVVETILYLAREYGDKCQHGWAVDIRITQQDLADLVGASRQAVNRVLRSLALRCYLSRKGRLLCIISLKRLARLAESLPTENSENSVQV